MEQFKIGELFDPELKRKSRKLKISLLLFMYKIMLQPIK